MILPDDIPWLSREADLLARATGGDARICRASVADLSFHESRFLAARALEAKGRPGWRFLDGPGPLTAEQSARVLHAACIRDRDGHKPLIGILRSWEPIHGGSALARGVFLGGAAGALVAWPQSWNFWLSGTRFSDWPNWKEPGVAIGEEVLGIQQRDVHMAAGEAAVTNLGWFCL